MHETTSLNPCALMWGDLATAPQAMESISLSPWDKVGIITALTNRIGWKWKVQVWFLSGLETSIFCLLEVAMYMCNFLGEGIAHGQPLEDETPFRERGRYREGVERERAKEHRDKVLDMWKRIHHFGSGSSSFSCLTRCHVDYKSITQPKKDQLSLSQIHEPQVMCRIKWL